ncbi:MAG: 3'(2'),5'-bisphosphate nucleotidase CysQ [Chroococcopsis gigantea SAG 12.99]|jgi:3'(2'), 5'-bisphosphate nucleotidase|nr:3'(2'),5'-bisphosphate nucleotidase CysQ [Chroococcopsis gigantea SAG 12.99]
MRSVGWGAAKILRDYYRGKHDLDINQEKYDSPVTAADKAANEYILKSLQKVFTPDQFGYLSEETYQSNAVYPQEWVWIIDPLDGTREFIEKKDEYAIHIALIKDGTPCLAVVVIPEAQKLYFAAKGEGTYLETPDGGITPVKVSDKNRIEQLYLVASRSHRDDRLSAIIKSIPFQGEKSVGSVGCKIATILSQEADVYISLSGKSAPKDWDFAAPELVLTEAGGKFTTFSAQSPRYNRGDVNQWGGFIASNGACQEQLCEMARNALEPIEGKV